LIVATAYAIAMGWLEAVVVVYIRSLLGLAHRGGVPAPSEIMNRFKALPWLMPTEQTREAATLIMLVTAACLAADRLRPRIGSFLVMFGVWDLAYYLGLYALIRWPPDLAAMDLLFLIPPHPWWYQPVWVPVVISIGMVGLGARLYLAKPPSRSPANFVS
jgi:hypothetical protein